MSMNSRALTCAGLVAGLAVALPVATAATAAAHVTIRPDTDTAGSWAKITVRVPNESDTAGTTQVRLDLPADAPFASVRVQPHPGWTAELTTEKLAEPVNVGDYTLDEAVTSVTWTAEQGARIGPDEFDEFAVSVGPLPEAGTYLFPAVQTYDDGTVVAWDQDPAGPEEEPSHPAPELTVVDDGETDDAGGAHAAQPNEESSADADTTDTVARGVGVGGIVVGAAGLGIGAAALRRRRA